MSERWYDKYIEYGVKELSSGLISDKYYNFRKMTNEDMHKIGNKLEKEVGNLTLVGIKTMGWEIAKLIISDKKWDILCYDPKKDTITDIYRNEVRINTPYAISDDVITTFGTINKCITKIGRLPEKVICIVNRMNVVELK